MSKNLQAFVDNFLKSYDTFDRRAARREQNEIEREKIKSVAGTAAAAQALKERQIGIEGKKADAYVEQALANADWLRRRSSGGGRGGGGNALTPADLAFMSQYGGSEIDYNQPQTPSIVTQDSGGPSFIEPPPTAGMAQGGRVRNGKVHRFPAMALGGKAKRSMALYNSIASRAQPNAQVPPARGMPPSAGTSGPGSGFGEIAAPPVGAINMQPPSSMIPGMGDQLTPQFQAGGSVDDTVTYVRPDGSVVIAPRSGAGTATEPDVPPQGGRSPYGNQRFGGATYGGNTFGGNRFGGNTYGGYRTGQGTPTVPAAEPPRQPDPYYHDPMLYVPYPENRGPSGRQQEWQGETDRANETPPPPRSGAAAATEPDVPPQYPVARRPQAPARPAAQPAAAISTAPPGTGQPLMQPAPGTPTHTNGANAPAQRPPPVTEPMGGYGYDPQGANVYGAGLSSNNAAHDLAVQGATTYASQVFHQGNGQNPQLAARGKEALAQGVGAPDVPMIQKVFSTVDPENKLPIHEKMVAATQATHDFYMKQGDKQNADKSAFEIAQFGNKMSSEHGKAAVRALQAGNPKEAIDNLLAGYNWLPDGYTAQFDQKQNAIVLMGKDGSVNMTIPIQEGTIDNLAFGMASGQLGWDVMNRRAAGVQPGQQGPPQQAMQTQLPSSYIPGEAGREPPVSTVLNRPAAQPSAAPAGPATPAAPQGASAPSTPAATAPPRKQAITTEAPTIKGKGPASAGAGVGGPKTAQASAGATATPQGDQPAEQTRTPSASPAPTTTPSKTQTSEPAGDPYAPADKVSRKTAPDERSTEVERNDQLKKLQGEYQKERQNIIAGAAKGGASRKALQAALTSLDKRYATERQGIEERARSARNKQQQLDIHDITNETKPRDIHLADEEKLQSGFDTRKSEIVTRAKSQRGGTPAEKQADKYAADIVRNSPLRFLTSKGDQRVIDQVARGIARNNNVSPEQAYDLALTVTSIVPYDPDGTKVKGVNGRTGKDALQFNPEAHGQRRGHVVLRLGGGRSIQLDPDSYSDVRGLHQRNWSDWEATEKKHRKDQAEAEKRGKSTLGRGLEAITPTAPMGDAPAFGP